MSPLLLVARRELVERGRDRSFLVSTAITLLLVVALGVVPALFDRGPQHFGVGLVPGAGLTPDDLRGAASPAGLQLDVSVLDRAGADREVRRGHLAAAYVAPGDVLVRADLDPALRGVLERADSTARGIVRLAVAGVNPRQVQDALAVSPLEVTAQQPRDPQAATREGIARVGTFLLYFQLLGYGLWVALGVVEEKSSRVVEVLLATVRARTLLAGKVLGIGLLGLAQLLLVGAVGLGAAAAVGSVHLGREAVAPVVLVLAWFLLGFAFYATAMAGMAARVSRQEDLQNVTGPFTLLLVGSFFGSLYATSHPDAVLSRVLALVPPFSALVNPPRVAVGDAAAWEVVLAVALMLAAVVGLVRVAGRLYEGAVLRTGARVGLRDAWRAGGRAERPEGARSHTAGVPARP